MKNGLRVQLASLLAASVMTMTGIGAAMAGAQDAEVPNAGLDLPANLQIFGKSDPNVRKPTAIVNNTVLTGTDVDHRVAMIVALNQIKIPEDQMQQLKLQVLRGLIDETLQIQEAEANEITITPQEVTQGFARVARNFNMTPEQLRTFLRNAGSSDKTLYRQIQGELAWQRVIGRKVDAFVNVSTEEVEAVLKRIEDAKGTEEFHVKEIYLAATPDRQQEVFAEGQKIIASMRQGQPFEFFATTRSDATTRTVGGDLGWVRAAVLPDALATAAQQLQPGQVAGPIAIPGGFSILYLVDKRQVLVADPKDARLSLRQMTMRFAPGTTEAQGNAKVAEFAEATKALQGCGNVGTVAAKLGAEVVDNDAVVIRTLPPQLQEIMMNLNVGEATPPFGTREDGVRVLVLCGRDDQRAASLPSVEEMQDKMKQERVNLRAQRMLRDLRRDAVVEYR
ncbi:peptidylprolyl isomerase [Sphingomonas sp. BGYR3]|uniref:peptidylprolyl isomerase n=1 Tax=Sphingomonas sp. BGYR3 TaxID=2975483 RepID=UPI0021A3F44B|nr:peptidylprolyl isomerase [Sphingomonas sp. BGYR3]MDG5487159.1 peptidylprolyl isomerase [Sphingomonas sp. BGYR3]